MSFYLFPARRLQVAMTMVAMSALVTTRIGYCEMMMDIGGTNIHTIASASINNNALCARPARYSPLSVGVRMVSSAVPYEEVKSFRAPPVSIFAILGRRRDPVHP